MLNALGANISKTDDGLIINGSERLRGGTDSSFGDHRIAMSAAVAASVCEESVTVIGAEAVNKSYPSFWTDAQTLGLICKGDK
jgi:3-phosphoshikimate 1-carboxyvinyltransferase